MRRYHSRGDLAQYEDCQHNGANLNAAADSEVLSDVRAAAKGDGAAYARIIGRFQQPLARRMNRFARGQTEIEELVHQVFVEAYFSLPKFRSDAPFEHWLQTLATRVGYRYWKQQARRRKSNEEPLDLAKQVAAVESNEIGAAEASETLARLLDQLPPRDRLVVTLMYVENRTVEETARETGWSSTMVKVQAFRARGKLRRLLEGGRS